jgi:hypothetical protein
MSAMHTEKPSLTESASSRGSIVEINLLLESRLLEEIEAKARERGLTAAGMVRCLLRDFLWNPEGSPAG